MTNAAQTVYIRATTECLGYLLVVLYFPKYAYLFCFTSYKCWKKEIQFRFQTHSLVENLVLTVYVVADVVVVVVLVVAVAAATFTWAARHGAQTGNSQLKRAGQMKTENESSRQNVVVCCCCYFFASNFCALLFTSHTHTSVRYFLACTRLFLVRSSFAAKTKNRTNLEKNAPKMRKTQLFYS